MKILFLPEVLDYFDELISILYEKDYFGFRENAENYVVELLDDIEKTLPFRLKKPAPSYFDKYGSKMLYSTFRKNKNTQWYVFFNVYQENGELIFLIRYIGNNHIDAQHL